MDSSPPPLVAPQGPKTVAQVLGEMVWLLTQSPAHRQLFVGDLEWFCMPAVLLEQFRIFKGEDSPAAVALWAFVSEETEQRLVAGGSKLKPDEWNNGDRPWLMELIAPFGGQEEILGDLSTHVFAGKPFKFHRVNDQGQRIVEVYSPSTVTNGDAV